MKYAPFQFCSHFFLTFFKWDTLYPVCVLNLNVQPKLNRNLFELRCYRINFACIEIFCHCGYFSMTILIKDYVFKYFFVKTFLIYFFHFQARATSALSTREGSVSALKNCWEILKCENISFVTLVTGAFPPPKVRICLSIFSPNLTE